MTKSTDFLESDSAKAFLSAVEQGEAYAPCPYCDWSCVVHPVGDCWQIDCQNCKRSTSVEITYVEEVSVS